MASIIPMKPSSGLKSALRRIRMGKTQAQARCLTTETFGYRQPSYPVYGRLYTGEKASPSRLKKIKVPKQQPSIKKTCPEPGKTFTALELAGLDPTGTRRRLIARDNPERLKVGDVALVRFRGGDPFAGLVLSVRHRGTDTSILLRNHLTRVGAEMSVKVFSPTVSGIEIVQRSQRRIRRARAYYFRKAKHDRGSLAALVDSYTRRAKLLGRGGAAAAAAARGG